MIGCLGSSRTKVYKQAHTQELCEDSERSKDKGESSRFKLRRKYRGTRRINTWGPGAWTKQCSWQKSQDGYKWKSGSCDRRKKAV